MREIKFRAWDSERKVMLKWGDRDESQPSDEWWGPDWSVFCDSVGEMLNKAILMQYTGLKDKNGREIYEGDICASPGFAGSGPGPVEWNPDLLQFDVKTARGWWLALGVAPDVEVIGNIYENPELLA